MICVKVNIYTIKTLQNIWKCFPGTDFDNFSFLENSYFRQQIQAIDRKFTASLQVSVIYFAIFAILLHWFSSLNWQKREFTLLCRVVSFICWFWALMLGSAYCVGKKAKLFFHGVHAVETSILLWYLIFQILAESWAEVRIILMGTLFFMTNWEESLTISNPDFLFVLGSEITKNISNSAFVFLLYSNCEIQRCFLNN